MRYLLSALLLIIAATAPLRAADQVPVRDGLHDGYSRIVFDWPRQVDYEARIEEGRLVVTFGAPADFTGPLMKNGLAGYASAPQAAEDGRGLTLPLTGSYGLNHFRIGSKVVIDLQQMAASQEAATPPEAALPTVRVRSGRHDGFSRLVFDWTDPVGEVLEEAPGRARLMFDRPASFDLSAVDAPRLPQIDGVTATRDSVTVDAPAGSRFKVERSGTKVVLDVIAPAAPAAAGNPTPESAPVAPAAARVEDLSPRPQQLQPAAGTEALEAGPGAAPEPAVLPAEGPTPLVPKIMGGSVAAEPKEASPGMAAGAQPAAPAAPRVADSERGGLTVVTDPLPDFMTSQAQGPRADAFTPVVMTFSWQLPTAAAAFRRGENLWLVFDRPAPAQVVQQIAEEAPHLGEVQLLEEGGATILLIRAQPTVVPRLSREGSIWTVDLRPRSPLPERALAAPVVESEEGGRVRYPVVGAGRILWVSDPDAGDRLVVVPIRGAGMGLTLPFGFPQFRSLQTHQGIVLQPLTQAIEVATVPSGVLVRDRNGLLVSKPEDRRSAQRAGESVAASPSLLELGAWRRGGIETFQENRQALQKATTSAGGDRLGIARLELARFFFAHGLDSETLGMLRVIEEENPRLARDPEVQLMKGASQLMLQDYGGANASLAHPALAGEREALLWQAALAAHAEDWQAAATGFAASLDLIEPYPNNVRLPLHLAAAEAFMRAGDLEAATQQITPLLSEKLDERELAQVQVVQGRLQRAAGDPERARELWSAVRDGAHRPSQARARLALIELGMDEGTLSSEAAIEELERLRFAWRGDLFEFTLLRKLAELYVGQNRHRDALYALREAVTAFPDGPAARNSAQRMREIFTTIYQEPGDPGVPPLRALALYQEFMELTPVGPAGDKMIAGLADRLVEVDLLGRAAELLEGQVRYRLEGEDKARIGARLALVQLLHRNPEAGLEALDISEAEGVDGPVAQQRRQLRARALSDLDRIDEALEVLAGDDSLSAEQLRADIHWRQRDWPEAVESLANLIPLLPPRRVMDEEESKLVVNLAVALLLAEEKVELEDLNRRYGAAMAKSPHSETFKLLVGEGEKFAVTSIADELEKVGVAQDFMASYRARLSQSSLSELN
ncbi:MAG: tetratricopeptide repeat protein [Kiloniellaceae bacterium]